MIKVKNKYYLTSFLLFLCIGVFIYFLYYDFINIKPINSSSNINENEVPYISTYYIKPVVSTSEDVIIDFYITDYYQTEYQNEDYSNTFTVTVKINGKKDIVKKNLKAGDHSINIGKFKSTGEQKFSIIVTDEYGRNSHELFNYFLVKDETIVNEYIVTESDLLKYNIKSTDDYEKKQIVSLDITEPTSEKVRDAMIVESKKYTPSSNTYLCLIAKVEGLEFNNWWGENIVLYADDYDKDYVLQEAINTREGIQKLLNDKKAEGYNKVVLYPGVYRIDHLKQIYIPTEFTLDLNGSTIKQNQFTGDSSLMIELNNTFDSHVMNGTLEGDYFSHDYINSPNSSEWVIGISIGGESKYSSYENLIVKDITGYGGSNGLADSMDGSLGYTYIYPQNIGDTFKLGDIDRTTGLDMESKNRTTSDFIGIEGYDNIGYLSISRYLGYQGNACDTWNIIAHFYDENKDFIQSIDAYQYRRIDVPEGARYIRVTILNEVYPTDLSIQYFRIPTHCSFKNIRFENCRAVGLAQAAMKDMLVENCEFTRSGQSLAKCAYDAEDGWDIMQDVTFRGLSFYDNPNNEFLTCAGHNFIVENMISGEIHTWERTNSYIIRNSTIDSASLGHSNLKSTGYSRFYNNTLSGDIAIRSSENDNWPFVIKDCTINGHTSNSINTGLFLRCTILENKNSNDSFISGLGEGNYKDSYISNKSGENHGGIYENCILENISGNLHGTFNFSNSKLSNFECNAGLYEPSYNFINTTLNEVKINYDFWHQGALINIKNSTITNSDYLLKLPHYSLKKPITISNSNINSNGSDGIIIFYDDRTGGSAGNLVKQDTIILTNNTINSPNSKFIVTGLTNTTVNNINLKFKDNVLSPTDLKLYDPICKKSNNISISE